MIKAYKIGFWQIICSVGSLKIKFLKLIDFYLGSILAFLLPAREKKTKPTVPLTRLLIIRPGGIGDAVFLVPFLRALRKSNPMLKIGVLCEKRNAEIFCLQKGLVDELWVYDTISSFFNLYRNRFDLIIDTEQWHYLSALVAYFLKAPHTIGFATRRLRAKLFHEKISYDQEVYELENFKKLFASLLSNVRQIKDINNCLQIDEKVLQWARNIVEGPTVAIFLGASIAIRRLNKSQSLPLIRCVLEKGFHVILLGGRDVVPAGKEIEEELFKAEVKNFIGKASLIQSAALIKQSRFFVGPDSGLMHLACAVGTPVVAIFGPGNLKKWGPKGERHVIVTENVECSPCTHLGYTVPTCRESYHCMRELNVKNLFQALNGFL